MLPGLGVTYAEQSVLAKINTALLKIENFII
jgi:hypothetical protein